MSQDTLPFYDDLAATADELLREFGADATLKRAPLAPQNGASYNPATAGVAYATRPDDKIVAAMFDYDESAIDGTLIQKSDKRMFISVVGTEPLRVSDVINWGGAKFTVVNPKTIAPAGFNVLYDVQVRR